MYSSATVDTSDAVITLEREEESALAARNLLPEAIYRADGIGPAVELGADRGKLLVVTMSINHVVEQESLIVSIYGSADGTNWAARPLVTYPQKYYCGLYSVLLNLANHPDIRFLRVQWAIKRWGKTTSLPLFSFNLYAEESGARITAAAEYSTRSVLRLPVAHAGAA